MSTTIRSHRRPSAIELIVMCVVTASLTIASTVHKLQCTFDPPAGVARITQYTQWACFSDVGGLYGSHQLVTHAFPYLSAPSSPGALPIGTAEYPTLTDLWMWLSGLPVASSHGFVIVTGLTFVPVAVLTTLLLARLAGRRAWVFAGMPPLFLYATYNWDLLPVVCVVCALFVELVLRDRIPSWLRALIAGVFIGLGAGFKLWPLMIAAPLAVAYVLEVGVPVARRVRDAVLVLVGTVGVVLVANVPFLLVNSAGWLDVIRFQGTRVIGNNTLSFWYFGLLPWSAQTTPDVQVRLNHLATVATAIGVLLALAVGVVIGIRRGRLPWVQTSAAMLCMYMVCNKVDSLQYTLWLLPFFVVLRIRPGWIIAYLAVDLATFIGWYHSIYQHSVGVAADTWADQLLWAGVAGHVVLLLVLAGVFLVTPTARIPESWSRRGMVAGGPSGAAADGINGPPTDDGWEDHEEAGPHHGESGHVRQLPH